MAAGPYSAEVESLLGRCWFLFCNHGPAALGISHVLKGIFRSSENRCFRDPGVGQNSEKTAFEVIVHMHLSSAFPSKLVFGGRVFGKF